MTTAVTPSNGVLGFLVLFSAYQGISGAACYVFLPRLPLFFVVSVLQVTYHLWRGRPHVFRRCIQTSCYTLSCFCFATIQGAKWTKIPHDGLSTVNPSPYPMRVAGRLRWLHPRWFSPEARSVIDRILVPDPKQRLALAQMKVRCAGPSWEHATTFFWLFLCTVCLPTSLGWRDARCPSYSKQINDHDSSLHGTIMLLVCAAVPWHCCKHLTVLRSSKHSLTTNPGHRQGW